MTETILLIVNYKYKILETNTAMLGMLIKNGNKQKIMIMNVEFNLQVTTRKNW